MRRPYARNAADDLRGHVEPPQSRPGSLAAQREGHAHRRIEMRARERPEHQDQHGEDRAGRQGVAKQRERDVPARQLVRP